MKLIELARHMIEDLDIGGLQKATLPRGLCIALSRWNLDPGERRILSLRLSRDQVRPSPQEVAICRQAFGVPSAAVEGGTETNDVLILWQEEPTP
jgi:hypothetical protein